jgi:hypothetical protein
VERFGLACALPNYLQSHVIVATWLEMPQAEVEVEAKLALSGVVGLSQDV